MPKCNAHKVEIKLALAEKYLAQAVSAGGQKKKDVLIRRAEKFRRQAQAMSQKQA